MAIFFGMLFLLSSLGSFVTNGEENNVENGNKDLITNGILESSSLDLAPISDNSTQLNNLSSGTWDSTLVSQSLSRITYLELDSNGYPHVIQDDKTGKVVWC